MFYWNMRHRIDFWSEKKSVQAVMISDTKNLMNKFESRSLVPTESFLIIKVLKFTSSYISSDLHVMIWLLETSPPDHSC